MEPEVTIANVILMCYNYGASIKISDYEFMFRIMKFIPCAASRGYKMQAC